MAVKFLDNTGLAYFWDKIKNWVTSKGYITSSGSITGNAGTATKFASNQSVALTGDVTGSASSKAGWSVATTLANSGVTAGSYGPSANATPEYGATFNVPYITVDAKGRVTACSTKTVKIPASDNTNTDTLMTQNVSTTNSTYPILAVATANATANLGAKTGIFGSGIKINPSTSEITATRLLGAVKADKGTGSYVNSLKVDGAVITGTHTAFGAIWNAPTKTYRVGCATYPTNDEKILWYSITQTNVDAGTNTVAKSMSWDGSTGALATASFAGNVTNCTLGTASRAVVTDANKKLTVSSVTSTELGYISGVTSAIQTQLNAKAPLASPALTGTPTAPTAAAGTNTTQIATTAFVNTKAANYLPLAGGTVTGTLILSRNTDADGTKNNKPALIIGGTDTAAHIEIDANEVMAKASGTTTSALYLNTQGGDVYIGGNTADYKSVTGRGKGSTSLPVYTDENGIVTACGTSLGVSITGNAATATTATDAARLKSSTPDSTAQKVVFTSGQLAIGTSAGNVYKGSSNNVQLISAPENGTTFSSTNANVQNLRFVWSGTYFSDIFVSPNNRYVWHRDVAAGTAYPWRRLVEENATDITAPNWNISIAGNAATATKLGTSTVGSSTNPIYLNAGTPTATGSRLYKTIGYNVNANAYVDMLQTYQSDNDNKRSCTIRCQNGDGFNSLYLGTHDESDNAPLGLAIRNTNGAVSLTAFGMLIETDAEPHVILQDTNISKGTNPTAINYLCIPFTDKNGTAKTDRIGIVESYVDTNGTTCTQMGAYKYVANTDTFETLGIKYDKTGTSAYTFAPTPAVADDSTKIATTEWCRDATGNFACNSATATKLKTARTIALAGDVTGSASFNGSANISIAATRRSCLLGQSSNTDTKPWYKVASYTIQEDHEDSIITFLVENTYVNHNFGILRVRVRSETNKTLSTSVCDLRWLCCEGFAFSDFVLVLPSGSAPTVELWTSIPVAYLLRRFTVLSEGSRVATGTKWTLYNTVSAGSNASIPTSGTQIVSKLAGTTSKIVNTMDIATISTMPAINTYCDNHITYAADGKILVDSYSARETDGKTGYVIRVHAHNQDLSKAKYFHLWCNSDGSYGCATCPTPVATANGIEIATAEWVRTFCDTTQKYAKSVSVSGSGNAVTTASLSNGTLTLTKGTTFLATSGNQSASGIKTFSDVIIANGSIKRGNNTENLLLGGGASWDANGGAHINLYGPDSSGNGRFLLQASKGGSYRHFIGTYDGNLTWNGATVSTSSDKRLKSNIDNVSNDILDTWELVNWEQFKFKDAIDEKGNTARLHVGLIAQDVNELFLNKDLDICDYGILCYDKWEDEYLEIDGKQVLYRAKGDLWTVRYTEALCMEAAYQRRKNKILEKHISELEKRLAKLEGTV